MSTLKLKPNSRKKTATIVRKPKTNTDWHYDQVGVMRHESGFKIQFYNDEECEIIHIPDEMQVSTIRELTAEAIKLRRRRLGQ